MSTAKVAPDQRHTPAHPCPTCGSHDRAPRGQGERCPGYRSGDGRLNFCARVESPETIETSTGPLFKHKLRGDCPCGRQHEPPDPVDRRMASRPRKGYRTPQEAAKGLGRGLGRLAGNWTYNNVPGRPPAIVYRFQAEGGAKTYRPVHRNGDGLWHVGDPPGPLPLYQLHDLEDARLVVVCEGEKPTDAIRSLGLVATTSMHGAQSPHRSDWSPLAGKTVVILPDHDEPGERYADAVAGLLAKLDSPPTVKVVRLPGLPPGGDAVEWIEGGGTAGDLMAMVDSAPPSDAGSHDVAPPAEERPVFTNYRIVAGDGENDRPKREPIDQPEVISALFAMTGGWPKRVGSVLFAHDGTDAEPRLFTSPDQLFAWIGSRARVAWSDGVSCVTQRRLYEALRIEGEAFDAIERHPHFPAVPSVYYACSTVARMAAEGRALEGLLDLFCPATAADRELIRAYLLTLFWGGPAGKRPMFLAEGPENDPLGGRGVGKSDLFSILAGLVGGCIANVSGRDDISAITKRIVNDRSRKRVVLLDNMKGERISWGDLEGMITGPTVGGHMLYVGDESRPNLLAYAMTINGGSFSEDLAQRTIMIRLDRPKSYDHGGEAWSDVATRYISEHRHAIISDIAATFERPAAEIRAHQRWASWTHAVLARCNDPHKLQNVVIERQEGISDDRANADEFGRFLAAKLEGQFSMRDGDKAIPRASEMTAWISSEALVPIVAEFIGERVTPLTVSKKVRRLCPRQLSKKDRRDGKGWRWVGLDADPAAEDHEWIHPPAAPIVGGGSSRW